MPERRKHGKEHEHIIVLGDAHERDKDGGNEDTDADMDGNAFFIRDQPSTGWVKEDVTLYAVIRSPAAR
jgi:hypothetical protein